MSKPGPRWEASVAEFFRRAGFPDVDKQPPRGRRDSGDLHGFPLIRRDGATTAVVIGCKNEKEQKWAVYMDELNAYMANYAARYERSHRPLDGVLGWQVVKRRNTGDGRAYAVCELAQLPELLHLLDPS